VFEINV